MAIRSERFLGPAYDISVEGTSRSAVSYVALAFRESNWPNPTKDDDSKLCQFLSRQYRAFKNEDPNVVQQKAVPVCVF